MNKALETVYKLVITKSITEEQFETLVKALLENQTAVPPYTSIPVQYSNPYEPLKVWCTPTSHEMEFTTTCTKETENY